MILNASGCLDALTAPDVAQQLDCFVTKTVTPLPRAIPAWRGGRIGKTRQYCISPAR